MAAPSTGMPIRNHAEDGQQLEGRNYIKWDDPSVQSTPEDEDEDIKAVADMINEIQKAQYNSHRHCYTGTHARSQGIVKGTLKTEPNLPPHLKQSMFAEEREWPVICRYSSEPGDPGLDVRVNAIVQEAVLTSYVGSHSPASRLCHESLRCPRRVLRRR